MVARTSSLCVPAACLLHPPLQDPDADDSDAAPEAVADAPAAPADPPADVPADVVADGDSDGDDPDAADSDDGESDAHPVMDANTADSVPMDSLPPTELDGDDETLHYDREDENDGAVENDAIGNGPGSPVPVISDSEDGGNNSCPTSPTPGSDDPRLSDEAYNQRIRDSVDRSVAALTALEKLKELNDMRDRELYGPGAAKSSTHLSEESIFGSQLSPTSPHDKEGDTIPMEIEDDDETMTEEQKIAEDKKVSLSAEEVRQLSEPKTPSIAESESVANADAGSPEEVGRLSSVLGHGVPPQKSKASSSSSSSGFKKKDKNAQNMESMDRMVWLKKQIAELRRKETAKILAFGLDANVFYFNRCMHCIVDQWAMV